MRHPRLWLLLWLVCSALPPVAPATESADTTSAGVPATVHCDDHEPLRQPYFGDLHIHTKYSLDASVQDTRTSPAQAYAFARGQPLGIQPWNEDGEPLRRVQLETPVDFAAVTDHAELMGEVSICTTPGLSGYSSWQCWLYRNWRSAAYYLFYYYASTQSERLDFCEEAGCAEASDNPWLEMQAAAEEANKPCAFSSFYGWEWTGSGPISSNLHRNVIFRNQQVPRLPISFIEAPSIEQLMGQLDNQCRDAERGCEAMLIPHNSNLSDGNMFRYTPGPQTAQQMAIYQQRKRYERLVEIYQHKGSSECYYDPLNSEDELCAFEQLPYRNFQGRTWEWARELPQRDGGFVRGILNDGLRQQRDAGVNPFKLGIIASTDTHLGTPGLVTETNHVGHGGAGPGMADGVPIGLPDTLEYSPGGLAALWAEQNTRDSLFDAMLRREAYGTSGPRIRVRFFGGADLPENMCAANFAALGYRHGVPMGGDAPLVVAGGKLKLAVSALPDLGTTKTPGTPLQQIQIVKGWIDASGTEQQRVLTVAGDSGIGNGLNIHTCEPVVTEFERLCQVWEDSDFAPDQHAWYYARVLEAPQCRWSQRLCVAQGVRCDRPETITEGMESCCSDTHRPLIQERAWTSPIWYTPTTTAVTRPPQRQP